MVWTLVKVAAAVTAAVFCLLVLVGVTMTGPEDH